MYDERQPLWLSSLPLIGNRRSVGNGASPFRGYRNECFRHMLESQFQGNDDASQTYRIRYRFPARNAALPPLIRGDGCTRPHQDRDRENGIPLAAQTKPLAAH